MEIRADRVEADQVAGHVKARHLFPAVFRDDAGLEEAKANGKQGAERFAGAVEGFSALDRLALGHQGIHGMHFFGRQSEGQAQLAQATAGTRLSEVLKANFTNGDG
ncbi:hypothetical protein YWS52_28530 [Chitiniphilus shinanonensis]